MYRVLLNVPKTCPLPALCWELGGIQMKYRVIMKKLLFLWHLNNLEEGSLAKKGTPGSENTELTWFGARMSRLHDDPQPSRPICSQDVQDKVEEQGKKVDTKRE